MATTITPHGTANLPDEILILIIGSLDIVSLARTALVSRHFDDLAEPFLYRHQRIMRGDNASALSLAIQKRKERVRWINSLLVSTKFGDDKGLELLPHHIRSMHNLKTLVLETPDCNKQISANRVPWINLQDRFERLFELSSILTPDPRQRLLSRMQECTLHFVDYRGALYSLTKYPTIFLHPTLKKLTISCTSLDFLDRYPLQLQVNTSLRRSTALEYLHLEECDINASTLAMLLSFPRGLKSLVISEGVRYDGDLMPYGSVRRHGNVHPQHLTEALAYTCAESLQMLSLSLGYRHDTNASTIHHSHFLRLTAMEKLLQLEVTLHTLGLFCPEPECDHETYRRFPPNLQSLKVFSIPFGTVIDSQRQGRPTVVPLPECIIREKSKHGVPNLNKVTYTYEYYADTDQLDANLAKVLLRNITRSGAQQSADDEELALLLGTAGNDDNAAVINTRIMIALLEDPRFGAIINNHPAIAQEIVRRALADPYLRIQGPQQEFSRIESSKMALLDKLHDVYLPYYRETNTELQIDFFVMPRGFIPPYLSTEEKPITAEAWWSSTNPFTSEDYKVVVRSQHAAQDEEDQKSEDNDSASEWNGVGGYTIYRPGGDDLDTDDEFNDLVTMDGGDDDDDPDDHDWHDENGSDHEDDDHDGEGDIVAGNESDGTEGSMYVDAAES